MNALESGVSGVTVTGLEELNRRLMAMAKEMSGPEMDAATLMVANEMAGDMRSRAHRALKNTIIAKPFTKNGVYQSEAFVAIDRKVKDSKGRMMGLIAHIFEFGTGPRYRKNTKSRGGGIAGLLKVLTAKAGYTGIMPKTPFFRPTVDAWRGGRFLERMAKAARSVLERRDFNDTWGGM